MLETTLTILSAAALAMALLSTPADALAAPGGNGGNGGKKDAPTPATLTFGDATGDHVRSDGLGSYAATIDSTGNTLELSTGARALYFDFSNVILPDSFDPDALLGLATAVQLQGRARVREAERLHRTYAELTGPMSKEAGRAYFRLHELATESGVEWLDAEGRAGGQAGAMVGVQWGEIRMHDLADLPEVWDPANKRPADPWWLALRPVARLLAQPGPRVAAP